MHTSLKIVSAAAVVLLVLFGAGKAWQYQAANTPQALETTRIDIAARASSDRLDTRLSLLAKDRCQGRAMAMLDQHAKAPITALTDMPKQLAGDLVLCVQRGIMSAYLQGTLKDAGLLKMLKPTS